MPEMYNPPDMTPYKDVQQAFAARNVLVPRSPGRKMSADMTAYQPVISLPGNADGFMQMMLSGLTATNFAVNGNFPTGTTGWSPIGATNTISNNVATVTGDGNSLAPGIHQATKISYVAGKKVYLRSKNKVTNSSCLKIDFSLNCAGMTDVGGPQVTSPVANTVYTDGRIITLGTGGASTYINIRVRHFYADAATAAGKVMEVKEVMAIDITTLPADIQAKSDAEIKAILDAWNWFDGTRDVQGCRVRSVGKNLFRDYTDSFTANGITIVNNGDQTLTINGTSTSAWDITVTKTKWADTQYIRAVKCVAGKTYRVSVKELSGTKPAGTGLLFSYVTDSGVKTWGFVGPSAAFIPTESGYLFQAKITAAAGNVFTNYRFAIQIEEGTTATSYVPYSETVTYIPGPLRSVPAARDRPGVQNVQAYTLLASDILAMYTAVSDNFDCAIMSKPSDYTGYNKTTYTDISHSSYRNLGAAVVTNGSAGLVGGFSTTAESSVIYFVMAKGTTLSQARSALAGTVIRYQLATPIPTKYKDLAALYAEPGGTIIAEPCAHGCKQTAYGTGKITVTTVDAPISSIESVYRIDTQADGSQIMTDVTSTFTVDTDKLGITGTGVDSSKPYEYVCLIDPAYSTVPPITYSYPEADALALGVASHSYGSAAADWVLTTSESQCGVLVATLASGAAKIIAPDRAGTPYYVQNDSGYTLTVKKLGGTGATVATGKKALVIHTGSDYVKFSEI